MRVTDAYREILVFLREQEADGALPASVAKALPIFERKANRMLDQLEARRTASLCPLCSQRRSSGVVCWVCFSNAPAPVRAAVNSSNKETHARGHRALEKWVQMQEAKAV